MASPALVFAASSAQFPAMSILHLGTMREQPVGGSVAGDSLGTRIRRLRKLRGWTQDQLAAEVASTFLSVSRWERDEMAPSTRRLVQLATALQVPEQWLRYGGGGGPQTVPVLGDIGAAQEVYPFADSGTLEEVEAPFGTRPDTRALIVRGDSMMPELGAGDFVLYRETSQNIDDLVGRRCVVRLADGRVLVKRLRRGTTYGRFTLESTNAAPLEDVEVVAAARVEGVVYR